MPSPSKFTNKGQHLAPGCHHISSAKDPHRFCASCRTKGAGDDSCTKGWQCTVCDSMSLSEKESISSRRTYNERRRKRRNKDPTLSSHSPTKSRSRSRSPRRHKHRVSRKDKKTDRAEDKSRSVSTPPKHVADTPSTAKVSSLVPDSSLRNSSGIKQSLTAVTSKRSSTAVKSETKPSAVSKVVTSPPDGNVAAMDSPRPSNDHTIVSHGRWD